MPIYRPPAIPASEITPRAVWARRREFVQAALAAGLIAAALPVRAQDPSAKRLTTRPGPFSTPEKPTPYKLLTTYCNFYEFGTDKEDPARLAPRSLRTRPWQVIVDGAVRRPRTFDIDELLKLAPLEERVYRLRCVEAWSAVVPWVGYPLSELIKRVEPTGSAKFV
ncbi:MAG: molybdopterin-dependent oxidoreductase, partial [Burkholderiaceae bacterium]|nr:molybdopterin-dependent oxidoreductase [Burkholderiaceae bacterium]